MPSGFADSHVHLHWYDDVEGVLNRAAAAGVELVVGVGVDLASSRRTIELAQRYPMVVAGVGFHPMFFDAGLDPSELTQLADLARESSVGFVGEIGIDTVEGTVPLDLQLGVLRDELVIAQDTGRAVNLHLRGDVAAALELISKIGLPSRGGVFHYFVGDGDLARRALDLGLHLSVGKPVTRPENHLLRQAIAGVSLDRLLIETDSYPLSGRNTEPADVPLVARALAELRDCAVDQVASATTSNLRRLLNL